MQGRAAAGRQFVPPQQTGGATASAVSGDCGGGGAAGGRAAALNQGPAATAGPPKPAHVFGLRSSGSGAGGSSRGAVPVLGAKRTLPAPAPQDFKAPSASSRSGTQLGCAGAGRTAEQAPCTADSSGAATAAATGGAVGAATAANAGKQRVVLPPLKKFKVVPLTQRPARGVAPKSTLAPPIGLARAAAVPAGPPNELTSMRTAVSRQQDHPHLSPPPSPAAAAQVQAQDFPPAAAEAPEAGAGLEAAVVAPLAADSSAAATSAAIELHAGLPDSTASMGDAAGCEAAGSEAAGTAAASAEVGPSHKRPAAAVLSMLSSTAATTPMTAASAANKVHAGATDFAARLHDVACSESARSTPAATAVAGLGPVKGVERMEGMPSAAATSTLGCAASAAAVPPASAAVCEGQPGPVLFISGVPGGGAVSTADAATVAAAGLLVTAGVHAAALPGALPPAAPVVLPPPSRPALLDLVRVRLPQYRGPTCLHGLLHVLRLPECAKPAASLLLTLRRSKAHARLLSGSCHASWLPQRRLTTPACTPAAPAPRPRHPAGQLWPHGCR